MLKIVTFSSQDSQEEVKSIKNVGDREVNKQRTLEKTRVRDPTNRKRLVSYTTS